MYINLCTHNMYVRMYICVLIPMCVFMYVRTYVPTCVLVVFRSKMDTDKEFTLLQGTYIHTCVMFCVTD